MGYWGTIVVGRHPAPLTDLAAVDGAASPPVLYARRDDGWQVMSLDGDRQDPSPADQDGLNPPPLDDESAWAWRVRKALAAHAQ